MGKRELLLAAAFVVLGLLVYQFTAPPADPSRPGFSLSRFHEMVRRELRGRRANAETTQSLTRPVAETLKEVRLRVNVGAMTITGEERNDVDVKMHVRSNGYDQAEAESLAKATTLKVDEAGGVLILTLDAPREGTQRVTLEIKVPARLGVRIDEKNGALTVTGVASLTMGIARAATTISQVHGLVSATQRGSTINVTDVGSLKLNLAAGAAARVSQVRGDTTFGVQTGKLRAESLRGALEVESRNGELQFEKLEDLKGAVRVNANLGEVVMAGLRIDARIDARESEIRVTQAAPAVLAIYNEGNDPIEVTTAPGGFRIDAIATGGRVTIDDSLKNAGVEVSSTDGTQGPAESAGESRATGVVGGGGPTLTLRATGGDIVLKSK